jgi:hypothetical protein
MNRDENENMTTEEQLASDLSPKRSAMKGNSFVGSSFVGAALDPQEAANHKISLATRNARTWTVSLVEEAFRSARPVAENYLRSLGRFATRNDVRQLARTYLASYVKQFGVLLPPGTTLGGSPLESVASDICGPLDVPLAFMPPMVSVPIRMAQQAPKQAKSWLARLFSRGPKAAPSAPAAPPSAAVAPASTEAPALAAASSVSDVPAVAAVSTAVGAAAKLMTPTEQKMLTHIVYLAKKGNPNAKASLLRLQKEGYAVSLGNESTSGAWMYKLNPLYWVKSSEDKKLIDKEREGWEKNAELQKKLGKREETLEQATKARQAQMAVQAAQARSAELEAQLKSIETQLSGIVEVVGDGIMGDVFSNAEEEATRNEVAPVLDRVKKARSLNTNNSADLATVSKKMASGKPLSPAESASVLQYLSRNERLHEFRKTLVSGENYAKNPARPEIQKQVMLGAMKAMTPTEQQMMVHIVKLAKTGNPNAQAALKKLQAQGYAVTMGDDLGFGISDAFSIATAPIKYGIVKPTQWMARKLGIIKGKSASPQQIRMQRLQAAAKRRQAAEARARAADAETEAEERVQAQEATAAEAEADAIDAQATAKEAQMATEEAQYTPAAEAAPSDESGKSKIEVTPLPPTPTPADQLKAARRALVAKKNPRAAKILSASEANTPQGKKLRAAMVVYSNAKKGSRKDRAAIININRKAKKGDAQARQDMLALKAARVAVLADKRAGRKIAFVAAKNAANKKGIAIQRRLEVTAANSLTRRTRAHKLAKVARIERKAAAGHKPSQAIVRNIVTKAKAGNKPALDAARAFKLAQVARLQNPTRAERKKQVAAHKMVLKLRKGNKKSLAELRVLKAAAAHGNPNAKKALVKVKTAAALETALATGAIVLPAGVALSFEQKKKHAKKQKNMQKHVASVQSKIERGTASREEALKAASEAKNLGDKDTATKLAAQATELPSAQDNLRHVATVASAAAAGSAMSQEKIGRAQTLAETGDASGVAAMGQLAAVKAFDDVRQGKAMDPAMKTAVQDLAKAEEGDVTAKAKIAEMQEQSKTGNSNAVKYMVFASGATVVARSLANNKEAEEEWKQKAGIKPEDTTNDYIETSKPALSLALPPMASSLSDAPLEPIVGVGELIKESLKALLFATRDPVQNYREAVLSRARLLPAIDGLAGDAKGATKKEKTESKKVRDELEAIDEELSPGLQAALEARKPKIAIQGDDEPTPQTAWTKKGDKFVAKAHDGSWVYVKIDSPEGRRIAKQMEQSLDPDLKNLRKIFSQNGFSTGLGVDWNGRQSLTVEAWDKETDPRDRLSYELYWNPAHDKIVVDSELRHFYGDATPTKRLNNSTTLINKGNIDQAAKLVMNQLRQFKSKSSMTQGDDEPTPKTGKAAHEDYNQPSFGKKVGSFVASHAAKKTTNEEVSADILGDDKHDKLVSATKDRLSKVIEAAGKGDKDAIKKWEIAKANYKKHKDSKDEKSKSIHAILEATGLFTKI